MIEEVGLKHFKCFEEVSLPLGKLTMLTGANASGKSSIMQSLVLLQQTMREHEWTSRLMLNGDSVKLGTVADIVDKINGRRSIEFSVRADGKGYRWAFEGAREDMSMNVVSIDVEGKSAPDSAYLRYLLPVLENRLIDPLSNYLSRLTYITAERIGPREFYPLADSQFAQVVGAAGENTPCVLHSMRDAQVAASLLLGGMPNNLMRQVEGRMRDFFPGFGMEVHQVQRVNAVTLGVRTSPDTDFHRPINVGFGISQILPIIVAALSVKSDDILLIENPEVHLHPSGQVKMGMFLANVASSGVQVLLETHSDHVLNGVRRAVREKCLAAEAVVVHYFAPRNDAGPQVVSPQINQVGAFDYWPTGFFDQYEKDHMYFAGWGK